MKKVISAVFAFILTASFAGGAAMANDAGRVMITAKYDADGVLTGVNTAKTQLALDEVRNVYAQDPNSRVYLWYGESGRIICAKGEDNVAEPDRKDVILIDYYDATIATVGGDRYYEAVLYEYSDTEAKLVIYQKDPEEEEERTDTYIVPYEAVERCLKLIEENKLATWNDTYPSMPLMGAETVCGFRGADGVFVRVSTDAMPEDGKGVLHSIGSVMSGYAKDEYKR